VQHGATGTGWSLRVLKYYREVSERRGLAESVGGDRREITGASAWRVFGAGELLMIEALCHASRKQQPVEGPLILRQHTMGRARREPNAHQTELARAVARNRIHQIERLLLSSVPDYLHRHV
jgi:hypothetical protein